MKVVSTSLNETEYKLLRKKLDMLGITEYALTKDLILSFIETGTLDKAKFDVLLKKLATDIAKDWSETKNNLF